MSAPHPKILFIDDDPLMVTISIARIGRLRPEWQTRGATSVDVAMASLEQEEFDVIVTDFYMPQVQGAEFLAAIHRLQPSSLRILASGACEDRELTRALNYIHAYLPKPFDIHEIVEAFEALDRIDVPREMRRTLLKLPMLPTVATTARDLRWALSNPDVGLDAIAELAIKDPAILAKAFQLTRHGDERATAAGTIRALGIGQLCSLVISEEELEEPVSGNRALRKAVGDLAFHAQASADAIEEELGEEAPLALAARFQHTALLALAEIQPEELLQAWKRLECAHQPMEELVRQELGLELRSISAFLLTAWGLPASVLEALDQLFASKHNPEAEWAREACRATAQLLQPEGRSLRGLGPSLLTKQLDPVQSLRLEESQMRRVTEDSFAPHPACSRV